MPQGIKERKILLLPGQKIVVQAIDVISSLREPPVLKELSRYAITHFDTFKNALGKRSTDLLDLALEAEGQVELIEKLESAHITSNQAEKKLRKILTAGGSSPEEAQQVAEFVTTYLKLRQCD